MSRKRYIIIIFCGSLRKKMLGGTMEEKQSGSKILVGILIGITIVAVIVFALLILKEGKGKGEQQTISVSRVDDVEAEEGKEDYEETLGDNVIGSEEQSEEEIYDKDDYLVGEDEVGGGDSSNNVSANNQNSGPVKPTSGKTLTDTQLLDVVYGSTTLSQGDIHAHLDNDGRADETSSFNKWKTDLSGLKLDFVASLDHYQTTHFENSAWSRDKFLYGTEAEASINGKKTSSASGLIHYNMLFAGSDAASKLRRTLSSAGMLKGNGTDYSYAYNKSEAWFGDLIKTVQNNGGFFVIPHPNQKRGSAPYASSALGYVFKASDGMAVERIGFEVISRSAYDSETAKNYEYWKQLLNAGYKYYACAGSDIHGDSGQKGGDGNLVIKKAITSIYTKASEKNDAGYLAKLRSGNFTAGAVGIKMCVGDSKGQSVVAMGGECNFEGKRLVVQIGGFYNYLNANAVYRVEIHTEKGVVYKQNVKANENAVIAFDADAKAKFYRVEVRYAESNTCVAYGNPIWNTKN